MSKLNVLDWIAYVLVIIGGLNWGLLGVFSFDLVASILGNMSAASRVVYCIIGIAAIYFLTAIPKLARE